MLALFARQIQGGGPVSVTDPEVARYFLTINEVAGLVIQAAALSRGGEIFLLDVGEEVRIGELAERLIRSRGMEPGRDIEIIYTGLRPGEKLRENLIGEHETCEPTAHPQAAHRRLDLDVLRRRAAAGIRELEVDRRRRTGNLPGAPPRPRSLRPRRDDGARAPCTPETVRNGAASWPQRNCDHRTRR